VKDDRVYLQHIQDLCPDSSVLLHRAIDLRRLPSSPSNSDGQKANDTAKPFACEENNGTTIRPTRQVLRSGDDS